jgi:hypothetical protein
MDGVNVGGLQVGTNADDVAFFADFNEALASDFARI